MNVSSSITIRALATLCLSLSLPVAGHSAPIAAVDFSTLPSSQGWNFFQSGPHNDGESTYFSVGGGVLSQDTTAAGNGIGSTGYIFTPSATVSGDYTLFASASVASQTIYQQSELRWSSFSSQITLSGDRINFGIMPTELYLNGTYFTPTGFDGTATNDFRIQVDASANSYELFLNGSSIRIGSTLANSGNLIEFGDNTGRADSVGTWSDYRIETGLVPEPAAGALIMSLGALVFSLVRRKRLY
jgi:hypothetical protein